MSVDSPEAMSVDSSEVVPVWVKVTNGCLLQLDWMIGEGYDINTMEPMETKMPPFGDELLIDPVMEAANMGYDLALNYLIEQGYSFSKQNGDGDTALGKACACTGPAFTACVEVLLRNGADMYHQNGLGLFPLTGAIMLDNLEVVDLFVRFGTDLLKEDRDGYMVVHYARSQTPETATSRAILEILEEGVLQLNKKTAFAMGHHKRLGAISMATALDPELIRMILALV
jgi:ankyrin repeat protein